MSGKGILQGNRVVTGLLNGVHISRKETAESSGKCDGTWKGVAIRVFNVVCRCHWLCTSPHGEIWSGNWYGLPSTSGIVVNTGPDPESGDSCFCKDPDDATHVIPFE